MPKKPKKMKKPKSVKAKMPSAKEQARSYVNTRAEKPRKREDYIDMALREARGKK